MIYQQKVDFQAHYLPKVYYDFLEEEGLYCLDELMAELDGRGALAVMHPTQPAVMVSDVNEEIPVPAFEYFVETTRAFLNMAQNDTFTLYPNIRWVVPHVGAFLSILADRFESFALMLRFADPDRRADAPVARACVCRRPCDR